MEFVDETCGRQRLCFMLSVGSIVFEVDCVSVSKCGRMHAWTDALKLTPIAERPEGKLVQSDPSPSYLNVH